MTVLLLPPSESCRSDKFHDWEKVEDQEPLC